MEYKPFQGQDYERLKADCLSSRRLFEDPVFPASNRSLFSFKELEGLHSSYIQWMRPREMCHSPTFAEAGFDIKDLNQGSVGNCWFIAGAIDIATEPKYLEKVVPKDQSFDSNDYAGIFHFRFWQFGDWVDVVVDDRLPVYNGKLAFCSNRKCPNEFWGPLLEKAYAKLNVCYEFLDGGFTQDAVVDMTGGVTEYLDINVVLKTQSKDALWKFLYQAHKMGSLIGANIVQSDPNQRGEGKLATGLLSGHAYSITKVTEILPNNKYSSIVNKLNTLCSKPVSDAVGTTPKKRIKKKVKKVKGNTSVQGNFNNYDNYEYNNNYDYNYDPGTDNYDYSNEGDGDEYEYVYEDDDSNNQFGGGGGGGGDDYSWDGGNENDNQNNVNISDNDSRGTNSAIRLMRLKNPWGDHHEFKGAWSDGSPEWNYINEDQKRDLGLVCENDGEFWMDYADFLRNFHLICTVHVNLHAFMEQITSDSVGDAPKWSCTQYHDEWVPNKNAGGCGKTDPAAFWTNPQFFITVSNSSDAYSYSTGDVHSSFTGAAESNDKATLIVSLMCKDSTREKNRGELGSFPKQFRIFKVKNANNAQNHKNNHVKFTSDDLERVGSSHVYSLFREVSMRFRLDPGEYVIIPSTHDKNVPGKFLIRLFTESRFIKIDDFIILDINDNTNNNDSKENFNDVEDTLFNLIDNKILSGDFSSDSEGEADFNSTFTGGTQSGHGNKYIDKFKNSNSSINNAFHAFKNLSNSKDSCQPNNHSCNLS